MLKRICKCKKVIPYEIKLCEECQVKEDKRISERIDTMRSIRDKRYKQNRTDKEEEKFYTSKRWRLTREHVRSRDNGLCRLCFENGNVKYMEMVHHIVELKEDNSKAYVPTNLISLCNKCHRNVHILYETNQATKVKTQDKLERIIRKFKP